MARNVASNVAEIVGGAAAAGGAQMIWTSVMSDGGLSFTVGDASVPLPLAQGLIQAVSHGIWDLTDKTILSNPRVNKPQALRGSSALLRPLGIGAIAAGINTLNQSDTVATSFPREMLIGAGMSFIGDRVSAGIRKSLLE